MRIFSQSKIYRFWLLFIIFLLPVIYTTNTKEAFEFPKMFFIYLMSLLGFCLFLTKKVKNSEPIKLPNKFALLFLISYVISTIFSGHVYTSLFGYYTRFYGGLLSILSFYLIQIILINEFTKKKLIALLPFLLFSMVLPSLFGIRQHFMGIERVHSTLGQPNWLAQFLVILLPLCMYLAVISDFLWVLIYLVCFTCLWFTYSVSGVLGFGISVGVLGFLFFTKYKSENNFLKFLLLIALSLIVVFKFSGIFSGKVRDAIRDVQAQEEVLADTHEVSDPGRIRMGLWQGTLDLIFSSPKVFLIGVGPGNFAYEFQKFRPTSLNYSSEWDFVLNKPHNYFLELWAEVGFLGLVAFMLSVVRLVKKLPHYLLPGLIGFLVTCFFGWMVVPTAFLFWYFVGLGDVDDN